MKRRCSSVWSDFKHKRNSFSHKHLMIHFKFNWSFTTTFHFKTWIYIHTNFCLFHFFQNTCIQKQCRPGNYFISVAAWYEYPEHEFCVSLHLFPLFRDGLGDGFEISIYLKIGLFNEFATYVTWVILDILRNIKRLTFKRNMDELVWLTY